jgi:hypothetical protein
MCKLIKCPKLRCYVFCYGDFGYVYCLKEAIHQNAVTAKQRPRNKHFIYSSIRYILDILQLLRSVYGIHIGPTLFHYVDHACAIWWHAAIAVSFFYMSQYFFHHVDHSCSMDVQCNTVQLERLRQGRRLSTRRIYSTKLLVVALRSKTPTTRCLD